MMRQGPLLARCCGFEGGAAGADGKAAPVGSGCGRSQVAECAVVEDDVARRIPEFSEASVPVEVVDFQGCAVRHRDVEVSAGTHVKTARSSHPKSPAADGCRAGIGLGAREGKRAGANLRKRGLGRAGISIGDHTAVARVQAEGAHFEGNIAGTSVF